MHRAAKHVEVTNKLDASKDLGHARLYSVGGKVSTKLVRYLAKLDNSHNSSTNRAADLRPE